LTRSLKDVKKEKSKELAAKSFIIEKELDHKERVLESKNSFFLHQEPPLMNLSRNLKKKSQSSKNVANFEEESDSASS